MTAMPWTDDRVATLTHLWADGRSAREIATQLRGVTRNAVLGKLHRLGKLGARPKVAAKTRATRPAPPPRPDRRTGPPPSRALSSRAAAPEGPGEVASVERLGRHDCRWPIGDPRAVGFSFCGRRAACGPYCPAHRAVAYAGRTAEP